MTVMLAKIKILFVPLLIAAIVGLAFPAIAKEEAAAQFDNAFKTLVSADDARDANRVGEAVKLYRQALDLYVGFAKRYPGWQTGVVKFRITYCNNQLEALMKRADEPGATSQPEPAPDTNEARASSDNAPAAAAQKTADLGRIKSAARRLMLSGDSDQAREILVEGLHLDPDSKTLRLMMGIAQCQSGMFVDALYLLAELSREDPKNPIAHLALGTACLGLGRADEATKEVRKAIELDPNLAEAHYDMARLLLMSPTPDKEGARSYYQKSLKLGGMRDSEIDSLLAPPPKAESSLQKK